MKPSRYLSRRNMFHPVTAAIVALALPAAVVAADGVLDPGFGGDGKVTSDFGNFAVGDAASDVVIQPDGKIVIGGRSNGGDLARYNADGSLDASFGGDGSGGVSGISIAAIALQSDGKIVVAGGETVIGTGVDFGVARFNANGSLDDGSPGDATPGDSFGTGGRVTTDFGTNENPRSLAIQADGKIVVVGHRGVTNSGPNVDFAISRYNTNGSLDDGTAGDSTPSDTFGTAGKVTTDFAGDEDVAHDVVIQPDGRIVVAGSREFNGAPSFAVARYLPTGAPDTTFDSDGRLNTAFNGNSFANAVALQSNGKIVAAGAVLLGAQGTNFALARYNPNGSLDTTFGANANGRSFIDFEPLGEDQANDLALQSDGKIVLAGYKGTFNSQGAVFAVARFLPNGTPDNSFGTGGMVTTDFGAFPGDFSAFIYGVALQADGYIVAAGNTRDGQFNTSDVVLARYVATPVNPGLIPVGLTMTGTTPVVTVEAHTGYTFKLQVAESLAAGAFTTIGSAQQGATGTTLTFNGPAISPPRDFYRVLVEPIGF